MAAAALGSGAESEADVAIVEAYRVVQGAGEGLLREPETVVRTASCIARAIASPVGERAAARALQRFARYTAATREAGLANAEDPAMLLDQVTASFEADAARLVLGQLPTAALGPPIVNALRACSAVLASMSPAAADHLRSPGSSPCNEAPAWLGRVGRGSARVVARLVSQKRSKRSRDEPDCSDVLRAAREMIAGRDAERQYGSLRWEQAAASLLWGSTLQQQQHDQQQSIADEHGHNQTGEASSRRVVVEAHVPAAVAMSLVESSDDAAAAVARALASETAACSGAYSISNSSFRIASRAGHPATLSGGAVIARGAAAAAARARVRAALVEQARWRMTRVRLDALAVHDEVNVDASP